MLKKIMAMVAMSVTMMTMTSVTVTAAKENIKAFKKEDVVSCDGCNWIEKDLVNTKKKMTHKGDRFSEFDYTGVQVNYVFNEDMTAYYQRVMYYNEDGEFGKQWCICGTRIYNWYPCVVE